MSPFSKFLLLALALYPAIALLLIVTDRPVANPTTEAPMNLTALTTLDYAELPPLQPYLTRDGATQSYRLYESSAGPAPLLILLHGSGWHSMQFYPLARALSEAGAAHVVTPDLRGHGFTPAPRGDIAYIGQLEDDLADLIATLSQQFPGAPVIVGGHSSGGGLAIRFAGGAYGERADGYLLLAPFLQHNAPTTRPNAGGWAIPNGRRIAGLTMLNQLGIHWFDGLTVIQFALPADIRRGPFGASATSAYSHRLNSSLAPRRPYGRDLTALTQPFLLVAGEADEAFRADAYEATISRYTRTGRYSLLAGTGHIDLLTTSQLAPVVADWLTVYHSHRQ